MISKLDRWLGVRSAASEGLAAAAWLAAGVFLWGATTAQPACAQESETYVTEQVTADDEAVEALTAGPVHEAFASPAVLDPIPSPIVPKEPPPDVPEEPPPYLPEGAVWIPGYWAWDDEREDFVWVSGVARVPPPSMRYVPGYWAKVEGGWQRVAGFWTRDEDTELEYRPAPPASLETGPSSPAPSGDHFWIPGCWVYRPTGYVWQAGYWAPYQPDWIWVPARWVWTPAGCLYLPGYWDYRLAYRGQIFAPIWFRAPIYRQPGWVYRPWCVIPTSHLFVHLWVRPQYCHYYFGNYYGTRYVNLGLIPWVNITIVNQRTRIYDPFYTYCRVHYRQQGVDFVGRIQDWHRYYAQHEEARPPRTWREQQQHASEHRSHASQPATQLVARRIDEVARQSDLPLKWVSLSSSERRKQIEEVQQVRELNRQRRLVELEAQARPERPEKRSPGPRFPREAPQRQSAQEGGRPQEPSTAAQPASPVPAQAASSPTATPAEAAASSSPAQPARAGDLPSAAPTDTEKKDTQPPAARSPRLKLPRPATASEAPAAATPQESPRAPRPAPKAKKAPPPPGARPGLASDATTRLPTAQEGSPPKPTDSVSPKSADGGPPTPSRSNDATGPTDRAPSAAGKAPASVKRPTFPRPDQPATAAGRPSPQAPPNPETPPREKPTGEKPTAGSGSPPGAVEKTPRTAPPRPQEEGRPPRADQPSRPDPRPVPLQRTQQGKKARANGAGEGASSAPGPATLPQRLGPSASVAEEAPAPPRLGDALRPGRSAERTAAEPQPAERAPGQPRPTDRLAEPRPTQRPDTPGPQLLAPRNASGSELPQRTSSPQRPTESREGRRPTPSVAPDAFPAPALERPASVAPRVRGEPSRLVPPRASDSAAPALERSNRPARSDLSVPPAAATPRPSVAPPRSESSPPRSPPTSRNSSGGRSRSREP